MSKSKYPVTDMVNSMIAVEVERRVRNRQLAVWLGLVDAELSGHELVHGLGTDVPMLRGRSGLASLVEAMLAKGWEGRCAGIGSGSPQGVSGFDWRWERPSHEWSSAENGRLLSQSASGSGVAEAAWQAAERVMGAESGPAEPRSEALPSTGKD